MSIGARVRAELADINKRADELQNQGFPPYVAYGKARFEWEEERGKQVQAEVSQLPESRLKAFLLRILQAL